MQGLKKYKVIDLVDLFNDNDKVEYPELDYLIDTKSRGNGVGVLEWVGDDPKTPTLTEYLTEHGFKKGEIVMYYFSW